MLMRSVLVILSLLLSLLSGCLSDAEKPGPEPIPAAMPHQGDKGLYTLLKAPLSKEARQQGFREDRLLNISFEFEGASVYHDRDGRAHETWDLLVQVTDEESPSWLFFSDRFHIDPSTFQVLGTTAIHEVAQGPTESTLFPTTWRGEEGNTVASSHFDVDTDLPCGLLESWQGGFFPSPGSVTPATVECSWKLNRWSMQPLRGLGYWGEQSHEAVVQERTSDGAPWIVVDHHVRYIGDEPDPPGPEWRAWYAEGIPYPVRVQDLVGGNFGAPGDELVLVEFERGKEPHPTLSRDSLRDLPPVVEEPLTPWTVVDLGVQHPWPLREAYAYARDDPNPRTSGFREFLEQHPDAYLASASHLSSDDDGTQSEHWSFTVVDEDEHFYVSIVRTQPLGPEPGPATYQYDGYGIQDELRDSTWPSKELLPRRLPTAQSLLAQWEVAMGGTGNPAASPSYSVSIYCQDDCQTASVMQTAGTSYRHQEKEGIYPIASEGRDTGGSSKLLFIDGAIHQSYVSTRTDHHTAEVSSPVLFPGQDHPGLWNPIAMLPG